MGKKSHTAAPSMKLSSPSKPTHPNPAALPKLPGMHSAIGNLGVGKMHKMTGKC